MRRFLLVLALLLCAACVFASGLYSYVVDYPFKPISVSWRDSLDYGLFGNPASLANEALRIRFPEISSSSYNISNALKDREVAEALSKITKFSASKDDWVTYLLGLVMATCAGYNDVFAVDPGFGVQYNNMAFGLNVNAQAKSMPKIDESGHLVPSGSPAGNGYVPMIDFGLTFAYGRRFMSTDKMTLDAGAAIRYAQKAHLGQLTTSEVSALLKGTMDMDNLPARGGFAIPLDLGVTLGFLDGQLNVMTSVTNINGFYYMHSYKNIYNALSFSGGDDYHVMYTPFSVDAGVRYTPKFEIVHPSVSFAFNGINLYFEDIAEQENPMLEMVRYLDAEIDVDVYNILRLWAAYRNGYPNFGIGLNCYGNSIELSYGFYEAGYSYGLKPVDYVSFRIRLGYEKF